MAKVVIRDELRHCWVKDKVLEDDCSEAHADRIAAEYNASHQNTGKYAFKTHDHYVL